MAEASELPAYFISLLRESYDEDDIARIMCGCSVRRKTTLRANTIRSSAEEVAHLLNDTGLSWTTVPWYEDAFVLTDARAGDLQALPAYEEGKFYVQSLSSMIPPLVLAARSGEDICDMCAAPGGKTTEIAALTGGSAYITACEMHEPRAQKLDFTLERQGARNVTVMRTDSRHLDDFFSFDRVLIDAPCSGSGTLSTLYPKGLSRFTPELVKKSVKSQRALLKKGLSIVRPGGTLVYSTCSVLPQENETIVTEALDRAPRGTAFELEPIELSGSEDIPRLPTTLPEALCVCPTELYEGFFVACIKRVQ